MPQCGHVAVRALQPEQALEDVHLDHAHHRPAFVAAEFHVGPINGGNDAAATFDAGILVGDDGHPASEIVAEVGVHAPFVPQPPLPPIVDRHSPLSEIPVFTP